MLPLFTAVSCSETQTLVKINSVRPFICLEKGKLRPYSNFLERENSDHGPSLGSSGSRGGRSFNLSWPGVLRFCGSASLQLHPEIRYDLIFFCLSFGRFDPSSLAQ